MPFHASGDARLDARLEAARYRAGAIVDRGEVSEIVSAVLKSLQGDISTHDIHIYRELELLARYIQTAQREIMTLRPDDIRQEHIPTATDQLDAVVAATEAATNTIMDACDAISAATRNGDGAMADDIQHQVTRIFEACNFQDITGQRITKVMRSLKHIEAKVEQLLVALGSELLSAPESEYVTDAPVDADLLNGPQLPGSGISQEDIDRLLASFD